MVAVVSFLLFSVKSAWSRLCVLAMTPNFTTVKSVSLRKCARFLGVSLYGCLDPVFDSSHFVDSSLLLCPAATNKATAKFSRSN